MSDPAGENRIERFGMAWLMLRVIFRAKLKLFALFALFAFTAFMLAGTELLRQAVEESANSWSRRLGADLMVIPAGTVARFEQGLIGGAPVRASLPPGTETAMISLPGVLLTASQYFLVSARSTCCEAGNLLLVGFDPAKDFTVRPWLNAGSSVQPDGGEVLIGGGVMKGKGATLRLYNQMFRVAARLEKSGMGYFDNAVFIPISGVAAMERSSQGFGKAQLTVTWGRPSLILAQLAPGADVRETADLLQQRVPGVQVLTISDLFREKKEKMARLVALQKPFTVTAWLFALAVGGAAQLLYWRERRSALGLLQAWGRSKLAIAGTATLETLLLSMTAMVAGGLGAFLLLRFFISDLTVVLGLPLLLRAGSLAAAGVPWLWLAFAGALAGETLVIMIFLLRGDAADLMRGG